MKEKIATILSAGSAIEKFVVNEDINKDCLLATSLLLGAIDIADDRIPDGIKNIERKKSIDKVDLESPEVVVIGLGGKDNAALRCFDVKTNRELSSYSVSGQVLKFLDLYDVAVLHSPWVEYYDAAYTDGQKAYATHSCHTIKHNCPSSYEDFGQAISRKLSPSNLSPLENVLLELVNAIGFTSEIVHILTSFGRMFINEFSQVSAVGSILDRCEIYYIYNPEDDTEIKVFDSSEVIDGERNSTSYVNDLLNNSEDYDVSVVVSNDTRGTGLSFFRRNGNRNIDFTQVAHLPGVIYASSEGRLVKTADKIDKESRKLLIEKSIVNY